MNIYTNSILAAVKTIVDSWSPLVNSGTLIEENQEWNTDPNKTPWICIYSPFIVFDPYRAQYIKPFMATINIPIYTMVGDFGLQFQDGARRLNDLSGEVYTAVSCYRDLNNNVDIVKGITIEPYDRDIEESSPLFADRITIIAEVFA